MGRAGTALPAPSPARSLPTTLPYLAAEPTAIYDTRPDASGEPPDGSGAVAALDQLDAAIDVVAALELRMVHPDDLPDVMRALTRARTRVDAIRCRALGELERRRAYAKDGHRSAKDWVANELHEDPRQAAADTRLGRDLRHLPALADAFTNGEISADHAAVAAREVRQAAPGVDRGKLQDDLVDAARTRDPRQLAREARRRRIEERPRDAAGAEQRAFERRQGRYVERPDGGARFILDLTPGDYEIHRTAVQSRMTKDTPDTPEELERTWGQRLYDAEMDIHRRTLAGEDTPTRNGTPVTGLVIVRADAIDADVADAVDAAPNTAAFLGFAGPVTAATARRLMCDGGLCRVVLDADSEVLDVGRTRRTATAAQVRALLALWKGCARCGAPPSFCEAHHIDWWDRDDGPTDLDNLLPLCWACHSAVHHTGLRIERRDAAAVAFISAKGSEQLRAPP